MVELIGRVFAAVPLSPDARLALSDQLGRLDIPGVVAPPSNWHITIRFLGTIDESTYERFVGAVAEVDLPHSFGVRLSGIGAFPNSRRAAVVWVGVKSGGSQLALLNEIAEDASQAAGLIEEDRPFHPHVTLSRVRPPRAIGHLEEVALDVSYPADRLVVYRSHMGRGGARYEPLEEFSLSS